MSIQRRPKKGVDSKGKVRWIVRWYDLQGKEHSKSFTTEKDAKKFESKVLLGRDKGQYGSKFASSITLEEFALQEWLPSQQLRASSERIYRQAITQASLHGVGKTALSKITKAEVQDFYTCMVRGRSWAEFSVLSPRTAGQHIDTIASIFRYAVELGYLDVDPSRNIKKRASSSSSVSAVSLDSIPSMEELQKIVSVITLGGVPYVKNFGSGHGGKTTSTTRTNPKACIPVVISALTGLRISEVLGLLVSDIDTQNRIIKVRAQKHPTTSARVPLKSSYSLRDVPYPDSLHPILVSLTQNALAGSFLCTPDGVRPYSSVYITKVFTRACQHLGLDYTFHSLRHFYASMMIDRGVPIPALSKIIGHSSTTITMSVYVHALSDAQDTVRSFANKII